ncbi:MAG: hypothetical protein IPN76_08335 [Saprospiraceae bacterium]|jgi:hypothetical protein|nr:hypothetical protein [Saprospiraceae bacterium]
MASTPFVLRLLISMAYFGVGVYILINRPLQSPGYDVPFALACFAYGAFRGYRAYTSNREENEN